MNPAPSKIFVFLKKEGYGEGMDKREGAG